jgi:hypothetical protein
VIFADEQEAAKRANDIPLGLSASVWTQNGPPQPPNEVHLGRLQGLRIRPRPVDLRTRRLVAHQTRHAQPRTPKSHGVHV